MERGDSPAEAASFRRLQLQDENGYVRPDGLMRAKAHVDTMRAAARRARGLRLAPDAAGIAPANWTWLGPGNVGGRVRAIAVDPTNTSVWLAGSVGGGIWKTSNAGANWAPLNDFMANLAVTTVVMQPGTPTTIYAGTGEGFYNGDAIEGAGIFKSSDGGATWNQLSSTASSNFFFVNRLAMSGGGVLLAATRLGIFRSTDGGSKFSSVLGVPDGSGVLDLVFHPTDSSKAVASGANGNAWYSTDGGNSWKPANGLSGGRVEIAYAQNSPATVYAVADVNNGSLYKSTDGGANFSLVSAPGHLASPAGDQGWYDNAVWVDPTNASVLVVGGIDLWRSINGGTSWLQISNWREPNSVHSDHHTIVSVPNFDGSAVKTVIFGNDGGVYSTADVYSVGSDSNHSSGWSARNNNLGITQFYGGAGNASSGTIIGGSQDNGTVRYTTSGGAQAYTTMGTGDGGFAAADPRDVNYFYGEYVYLQIYRSKDGGLTSNYIYNSGLTDAGGKTGANFIAPFLLDPNNSNTMLAGGRQLWRSTNIKASTPAWSAIKPASTLISAIAVAPGNSDLCWVGDNGGAVYKTTNCTALSPLWTRMDINGVGLPARYIARITVDPNNASRVYVALGGYSVNNLWRTNDGGSTWASVSGSGTNSLPPAPVRDLAVSPDNSNALYAASEVGVFASDDQGASWSVPQDGPANVSVDQLFWMGKRLIAVTHGRGLYSVTPNAAVVGTCSTISTGTASTASPVETGYAAKPAEAATPGGNALRVSPALAGNQLPPGGAWTRQERPDGSGETWTYNFTIAAGGEPKADGSLSARRAGGGGPVQQGGPTAPGPGSGGGKAVSPANSPRAATLARPSTTLGAGGGTDASPGSAPAAPPQSAPAFSFGATTQASAVARGSESTPGGTTTGSDIAGGGGSMIHPNASDPGPSGGIIQRRFVLDSDPRQPSSARDVGWTEFWFDGLAGETVPPEIAALNPSGRAGWVRVDPRQPGAALLRTRGSAYRRILPGSLAGIPAAGLGMTAEAATSFATRHLASPFTLARTNAGRPGIAAFDINFDDQPEARQVSSVRLYLKLSHPHLDQVTVWLVAGGREAVLWDGRGGSDDAGSDDDAVNDGNITLDRVLESELRGAPLSGHWTLYVTNGDQETAGVLEEFWLVAAAASSEPSIQPAFAGLSPASTSLDIAAQRAYLRTAPGSGSEVPAPALGQSVYLTVDWQLSGTGGTVTVPIRALLDGSTFCSFNAGVSAGSWTSWCNNGWVAIGGTHTIEWDLDYTNAIPEVNENNNVAFTVVTTTGADIAAQRSYLRTASGGAGSEVSVPALGQIVFFTTDFQLSGASNTVSVSERAVLDGNVFCSFTTTIGNGSWTSWCNNGWTATAGSHTVQWDFDYTNQLSEINENNNSVADFFTTAGVDIVAQRAYLRTAAGSGSEVSVPLQGQSVYFTVDWMVTGGSGSLVVPQRALLDGGFFCASNATVPAGSWTSWCNNGWVATAGTHSIEWDLDYTNSVPETNENNNTTVAVFTTAGADIGAQRAYLRTAAGGGTEVTTPAVGQVVYFTVDWSLSGTNGTSSVPMRALLDGSTFCSFSTVVASGSWTSWCNNAWAATAGTHTLEWDLDYTNSIAEIDESNNTAVDVFSAASTLDLAAQRAYLRSQSGGLGVEINPPSVGQTVYFTLDWQVTGSGGAVSVDQRAVIDGGTFCAFSISGTPGSNWTSWCNNGWTVTPGPHTLAWDLDYNNAVPEINETNNSAVDVFSPASATPTIDIAAQRAYLRTDLGGGGNEVSQPTVGQTVYFYADWQVTGTGNAVTVAQRAVLDGNTYCSGSASASPTTAWFSWCNSGWVATAGTHNLRWDLDYTNSVPETNENNNSASASFTPISSGPTLDIVAVRAYLASAAGGGATEVSAPTVGQTVYFYLDWQLNASGGSVAVEQRVQLDGNTFCSFLTSVTAGSWTSWCNSGWTVTAGTHTLQFDLDYNNTIAETNENNNSAQKTFTPAGANTLDIAALRSYLRTAPGGGGVELDPPAVSQTVYPSLDWQITGSPSNLNVGQRTVMDGATLCACSALAAVGGKYLSSCSQGWTASPGAHTLRWDLDYNNAISETNKTNNSATKAFTLASGNSNPPALSIAKAHSGNFSRGQQNATYQLGVANSTGAGSTSGTITVTETVPSGLSLVSMSGTGWTCPGTAANNCTRSDVLGGGASYAPITVTVNVAGSATSPQVNQASVSGGGSVTASANDSTAINLPALSASKPGIFRQGFLWVLDANGNHLMDDGPSPGPNVFGFGGLAGDIPIYGDWNGDGRTKVGFVRNGNQFFLDYNGNHLFEGAGVDRVYTFGGLPGDIPVVGDWTGDGKTKIGIFRGGVWILDLNGNGIEDPAEDAAAFAFGGFPGDVPVVGDWTGSGKSNVGVFRQGFLWVLDTNGNHTNGAVFPYGGFPGDRPVVGDWAGTGVTQVGIFRQGFLWALDANGNRAIDEDSTFIFAFGGFLGPPADVPVVGKW